MGCTLYTTCPLRKVRGGRQLRMGKYKKVQEKKKKGRNASGIWLCLSKKGKEETRATRHTLLLKKKKNDMGEKTLFREYPPRERRKKKKKEAGLPPVLSKSGRGKSWLKEKGSQDFPPRRDHEGKVDNLPSSEDEAKEDGGSARHALKN